MLTLLLADPWHFFYARAHLWDAKEEEKAKADPSQALIDDVGTTLRFIDEDFSGTIKDLVSLLSEGDITFDLLWTQYPVGEMILVPRHGDFNSKQIIRLMSVHYLTRQNFTRYFLVLGELMTYDGEGFGRGTVEIEIDAFEGSKKIITLAAFPLQLYPNAATVRETLIQRGRKYVNFIRHWSVHSDYSGNLAVQTDKVILNGKFRRIKVAVSSTQHHSWYSDS